MVDVQYKTKTLKGLQPPSPVNGGLAPNTVMRFAPFRAALAAQDAVPATSRRKLAEYGLNGSDAWHVPPGTDDPTGASQLYPDGSTWRTVESQLAHLTPGCMLEAHVMYVPAGLTAKVGGPAYHSGGAWGELRIGVTWTSEDGLSTTGPHYFGLSMEGSKIGDYTGGENTDAGADWMDLRERLLENIRPPDFASDPAVAVAYSEWADVEITIELLGSPRIVHMIVYEVPLAHVTEHDNAGDVSVHAIPAGANPFTPRPMEKAHDGATYEEHRFGTTRMLQVAARQASRLGPRLLGLSAWDEDEVDIWQQTEATPFSITQVAFRDIYDSTNTTYDADNPGFIIAGSHAQLHRLCDPNLIMRAEAAVVPVRVRVDAAMTGGTGTVRVQSGAYEWVDVSVTGARAIYQAIGYLESQVHADHAWALAQIFARVTAGTLTIFNISVDFGTW